MLVDEGGLYYIIDQVYVYVVNFEVWDLELVDGEGDFCVVNFVDKYLGLVLLNVFDLLLMVKVCVGFYGLYGFGINQIVKGMGGVEYIVLLMVGYVDLFFCVFEDFEGYYNNVFIVGGYLEECKDEDGNYKYLGSWIVMVLFLYGEDVDFDDGYVNDLYSEVEDVVVFLMWIVELKLNLCK